MRLAFFCFAIAVVGSASACVADGEIASTEDPEADGALHEDGAPGADSATPGEDSEAPDDDSGIDSSSPPAKDSAVADSKPPVEDTAAADTAPPGDSSTAWPYASLEDGILAETNKRRAAGADCHTEGKFGPAGPLVMQAQLQSSARKHSKDMAEHNYFSHTDLAGGSPFDRMKAEGYTGGFMGENIAAGNATVAATMDQWMKSDGHCANIMNPKYKELGVGYYYSTSSTYKHYWTQNFGAH